MMMLPPKQSYMRSQLTQSQVFEWHLTGLLVGRKTSHELRRSDMGDETEVLIYNSARNIRKCNFTVQTPKGLVFGSW